MEVKKTDSIIDICMVWDIEGVELLEDECTCAICNQIGKHLIEVRILAGS